MGLSASSVIPLLSKWEEYLSTNPDGDITGFAHWVLAAAPASDASQSQHPTPPSPLSTASATSSTAPDKVHLDDTAQSLLLISRLHRILQFRSKPIAKELGFTKPMEFSMLVQVAIMNKPNKKQLCQEMLIEGSTGVEITKRLAARGFIKEQPDANDRRSALLSLAEKGKQTLLQGYTKLDPIHSNFLTTLTTEEKRQLVAILGRLNEDQTRQLPPLS
jgi:DNA-binding MarR family transcriptional regulator